MKKNFKVDQGNAIICEGQIYDLHNFYNFQGFNFDVAGKIFYLHFTPTSQSQELKEGVSIKFVNVDALELSGNFVAHINHYLYEIGYKSPYDRDHDWIGDEESFSAQDHMFFRFESDEYIRVHGSHAIVEDCAAKPSRVGTALVPTRKCQT